MTKFDEWKRETFYNLADRHFCKLAVKLWTDEIGIEARVYNWDMVLHTSNYGGGPNYTIQIRMPEVIPAVQDTGLYGLTEDNQAKWNQHIKRWRRYAKLIRVPFAWPNVDDAAVFWNKEDLERAWGEITDRQDKLNDAITQFNTAATTAAEQMKEAFSKINI